MATSKIAAALATLDDRTRVTKGTPATAEWIAAQEKASKTKFCPAYVAFLKEFGALRLETDALDDWHADLVFPGHADDEVMQLETARTWLENTFEDWSTEPTPGVPVVMYGDGSGWPDALVTAEKKIHGFHRNELYEERGDFEDAFVSKVEAIREGLGGLEAEAEVRSTLLEAAVQQAPAAWKARFAGGHATFVRPSDGVEVLVRLGDGRELHTAEEESGVFVGWYEPGELDLETLNARNRGFRLVRGAPEGGRTRFRGLLPVTGLDAAMVVELVAHDAGLPLEAPARSIPAIEVLKAAVARAPEERSIFAKRWRASDIAVEGDTLVLPIEVPGGFSLTRTLGPPPEIRVRARADGLVEVVHRSPTLPGRETALQGLALVNGNQLGENNADLEPCVRGVLEAGDVAALSVVVPFGAVAAESFLVQLTALSRAIQAATFLAKPDPMVAITKAHEQRFGLPFGPHGRALLDYTHDRSLALLSKSHDNPRFSSPWGTLVELAERSGDLPSSFARQLDYLTVRIFLAVDHGTTSDDCPVVGVEDGQARLLARNLAEFVSVLLLQTTGFDFDGDDDRVWRAFRSTQKDARFSSPRPEDELAERLGVKPATKPSAVLAAVAKQLAPRPATGEVTP